MREILNFIDGRLVPAADGQTLDNIEPATGTVFSRLPASSAADINAAVLAAKRAFPAWSQSSPAQRSKVLLRIADLIESRLDAMALAESIDTGKPLALAREVDIPRSAANFRFFATAILHCESAMHETRDTEPDGVTPRRALNYTLRAPRGVAGLISPWNLPLYLLSWKIAPALATGNTAVAKPSEMTPLTAFLLSQICDEAGLPHGVLNIVHGSGQGAGVPLVTHPDVPAISFTGGTSTGKALSAAAAPMFKRLSLELGGKNPTIVFDDADFDLALSTTVQSSFRNQGQICLCASRILVQRSIFQKFVAELTLRAKALRIGDPLEPTTQQGALNSAAHLAKVAAAVDAARALGGTVHCGGRHVPRESLPARCAGGFFYEPTILSGLDPACPVEQEEIFGPVVSITPFDDEAHAIRLANGTNYGLATTLWTRDLSRAHRCAEQIESGIVWVNCWMLRDLRTPFGGVKQSGVGREGGVEALRFFTESKNVCIRI
jgi:aminomuconate-semialdehyde/2-hydroxymuconate-6-semialdehyde dehydrogenase